MGQEVLDLKSAIAEKVGLELVDLIPPKQWEDLIDSQVDHFMKELAPALIQKEIQAMFLANVKARLSEAEFIEAWDGQANMVVGPAIQKLLVDAAPEVFASMMAPYMANVISSFRNQMPTQF